MRDPAAYAAALARLEADTRKFQGLPQAGAIQLTEEYLERLLLLPDAKAWEESGISAADGAIGAALVASGVGAPIAGLGVKGSDYVLHLLVALATAKAKRDEAARQAQINGGSP